MGQGLHTKMLQVASRVLEIPVSKIYINETATDKVPNTSPTAASAASDLNGMAVLVLFFFWENCVYFILNYFAECLRDY